MLAARAYAGPYPTWPAPTADACRAVAERLAAVHGWPHVKRQQGLPAVGCEERRSVLDSLVRRWGRMKGGWLCWAGGQIHVARRGGCAGHICCGAAASHIACVLTPPRPPPGQVRTLLSQNTTDKTSGRAFATLKQRFPSWEAVRAAPMEEVADAIRVRRRGTGPASCHTLELN